jgi:hypothetical protein
VKIPSSSADTSRPCSTGSSSKMWRSQNDYTQAAASG